MSDNNLYPETAKLRELMREQQAIKGFLEWVEETYEGQLLRFDEKGGHGWVAIPRSRRQLILEYLGIDLATLVEEEKARVAATDPIQPPPES